MFYIPSIDETKKTLFGNSRKASKFISNVYMLKSGSFENKDPENKDPKTHYKNEDPLQKRRPTTKTKTHYENEDVLRKRMSTTKITFGANTKGRIILKLNTSSGITK